MTNKERIKYLTAKRTLFETTLRTLDKKFKTPDAVCKEWHKFNEKVFKLLDKLEKDII